MTKLAAIITNPLGKRCDLEFSKIPAVAMVEALSRKQFWRGTQKQQLLNVVSICAPSVSAR